MRMRLCAGAALAMGLTAVSAQAAEILDLKASDYNPATGVWADSSGNGDNATVLPGDVNPLLVAGQTSNGSAVVRFAGSSALVLNSSLDSAAATGYTVFAYVRPTTTDGNTPLTIVGGTTGALQYRINGDGNGGLQEVLERGVSNLGHSSTALPTSAFSLIDVTTNSSASAFRLNGANDGAANGGGYSAGTTTAVGSALTATTTAGVTTFAANESFSGDIAEIVVYSGVLSAADIQTEEASLNAAYTTPEPASLGLLSVGAVALLARRRRA